MKFTLNKKQLIILAVVLFFVLGLTFWLMNMNNREKIFTVSGVVSGVNAQDNFLTIKSTGKEKEIKVIISDATKLIKLGLPFGSDNPIPPGTQFTPIQTKIAISDFKTGDSVFIKSAKNITGKSKISDIELIQIMP